MLLILLLLIPLLGLFLIGTDLVTQTYFWLQLRFNQEKNSMDNLLVSLLHRIVRKISKSIEKIWNSIDVFLAILYGYTYDASLTYGNYPFHIIPEIPSFGYYPSYLPHPWPSCSDDYLRYSNIIYLLPVHGHDNFYKRFMYFSEQTKAQSITKMTALMTSILNLWMSSLIFLIFDFSFNNFQFVIEPYVVFSSEYILYIGLDGVSIYFVLLTTIITPIVLLSNWKSICENIKWYVIIILLLETLLLTVFIVLDIFLFYIFFESILGPLFILIGLFGSNNRVRASFYLFIYTLLASLFLLLSIISINTIMGTTDLDALFKTNFSYTTQFFLFYGTFIAFAVKTPVIFLNIWLLKAHVESPLGGSILLAAIVLKLSIYGILRLILPILPKASLAYTFIVYLIGVITIIYASFSTLRTIDVKELIAYSSVSHAAVYILGVFSNTIKGIEGSITLGLAHGFVSSGLFLCAGGVLYDRSSTRLITFYRGLAQIMPLFSICFFILCLSNAGTPISLNFLGEFLSLYGSFERLPLLGSLASSSIVLSAAYTIYMFNRISFAGKFSQFFTVNIPDLSKREFNILLVLVLFTIMLGIFPSPILDGLHYYISCLLYSSPII